MNYRRGLNRIFLVLWAIWVLVLLVGWPWSYVQDSIDRAANLEFEAARETNKEEAAEIKELARLLREQASYIKWYRAMLRDWQIMLFAIVGLPVAIYGLLFGVIIIVRWILRGFRHHTSQAKT